MDDSKKELNFRPHEILELSSCINKFRLENLFCDVVIKLKEDSIYAHGAVLSAHSSYFKKDLLCNKGVTVIDLTELDPSAVKACIEYIYTGEIIVNFEVLEGILRAALLLKLNEVESECMTLLKNSVGPEGSMFVRNIASTFGFEELLKSAELYITTFTMKVVEAEKFLEYTREELDWLIENKKLPHPFAEMNVYEGIIRWVKHDRKNREEMLPELIQRINLNFLSVSFMNESIQNEPMVMKSHACMNYLLNHLFKRVNVGKD